MAKRLDIKRLENLERLKMDQPKPTTRERMKLERLDLKKSATPKRKG